MPKTKHCRSQNRTGKNKTKKQSQFKRKRVRPFDLTIRDREIIRLIFENRFLTSNHIQALLGGSRRNILARLHLLFNAGFIDRPPAQTWINSRHHMVYGLGNKGARLLADEQGIKMSQIDWSAKNRKNKRTFLEHRLMVSDFMVTLNLACRSIDNLEFIPVPDILARRQRRLELVNGRPISWRIIPDSETGKKKPYSLPVVPDDTFGLCVTDADNVITEFLFYVEADRSTMPIKRTNPTQSSFHKKLLGYWYSQREGCLFDQFGFKSAKLLVLTISEERLRNMITMNSQLTQAGNGVPFFLFAPLRQFSLDNPTKIFEPVWLNGQGRRASILGRKTSQKLLLPASYQPNVH